MSSEPKLNSYLDTLDQLLRQLPASERAEIIMEMKSHVLDALEKDPSAELNGVLKSLGDPEQVAKRFLAERGITSESPKTDSAPPPSTSTTPPPAAKKPTSWAKWLSLTFLGTFAGMCLLLALALWKFTPILSVDGSKVSILGGAIKISEPKDSGIEDEMQLISGDQAMGLGHTEGSHEAAGIKEVEIKFSHGSFEFSGTDSEKLKWNCAGISKPEITQKGNHLEAQFANSRGAVCKFDLPKKRKTVIDGINGKVDLNSPNGPVDLKINNGVVDIRPDSKTKYKYDLQAERGLVGTFDSSEDPQAILIQVRLKNGAIENRSR